MAKKRRKGKKKGSGIVDPGAVTLTHSANAPKPVITARLPKDLPKSYVATNVKSDEIQEITNEVIDSWEELECYTPKTNRRKQMSGRIETDSNSENYNVIPYDFWELLSDYLSLIHI